MQPPPIINVTKISPESEKRIVKMYRKDISMCKIAKEFSVSTGTVYLHLKKYIPKEERQKRQHVASFTEEQAKDFCALYKKGMSSVAIGDKYGLGADIVLYALNKYGIDTSKGGKHNPNTSFRHPGSETRAPGAGTGRSARFRNDSHLRQTHL